MLRLSLTMIILRAQLIFTLNNPTARPESVSKKHPINESVLQKKLPILLATLDVAY
jgi:hypothetical protein